ncbi:Resolvase domain protein [Gloeothece citriformis PCC 7424]|uniref:Resolvase domain protein n=1 Tax=Gloeothece citriformis (strain PCC 7424) TaxID=65393 RepID=B7K9Y3_GLOC7|nr:IS607 family transposase [Gloeothece citriformis]ACK69454.1 Resolvase domain protein [Gloeothece citriformis PCC 7424]ACK71339.1 Resolvase domain protein [Gloeothece citriformis PCC 7424]
MKEKLLTTAETCEMLHVSRWTLKKWEDSEELIPIRTKGGHRRYKLSDVNRLIGNKMTSEDTNPDIVAVYCRVSSHEQKTKGDLDRQKARVLEHCLKKKYNVEYIFTEVGSGMNDNRSQLKRLFHLVRSHLINRVLIEHKDRLTRFNYSFLEAFFSSHGVVIECLENILPKSYEAELVEDIVSLMASMSAKIYGKRSACNRKKKAHL